jgi:hypothetical protein
VVVVGWFGATGAVTAARLYDFALRGFEGVGTMCHHYSINCSVIFQLSSTSTYDLNYDGALNSVLLLARNSDPGNFPCMQETCISLA